MSNDHHQLLQSFLIYSLMLWSSSNRKLNYSHYFPVHFFFKCSKNDNQRKAIFVHRNTVQSYTNTAFDTPQL